MLFEPGRLMQSCGVMESYTLRHCPSGHFATHTRLYMMCSSVGSTREVQCPEPACGTRDDDPGVIRSDERDDLVRVWMRSRVARTAAVLSSDMETQRKEELKARLAAYPIVDGAVKRHTDAVVHRCVSTVPDIACTHFGLTGALQCDVATCRAW